MPHNRLPRNETPATPVIDFNAMVERHYKGLYRFAFGLTGSESDAANLTQEACRALLVKGRQIRDAQKVKSWLFAILYREFLDQRGRARRVPDVKRNGANHDLPCITPGRGEDLDASVVVSALQTLEEKFRATLVLFYLQDLSCKEIADVLAIPIDKVMSRLTRGKDQVRQRLETNRREASRDHSLPSAQGPTRGGVDLVILQQARFRNESRPENRRSS